MLTALPDITLPTQMMFNFCKSWFTMKMSSFCLLLMYLIVTKITKIWSTVFKESSINLKLWDFIYNLWLHRAFTTIPLTIPGRVKHNLRLITNSSKDITTKVLFSPLTIGLALPTMECATARKVLPLWYKQILSRNRILLTHARFRAINIETKDISQYNPLLDKKCTWPGILM